jgi:hypothetical protein
MQAKAASVFFIRYSIEPKIIFHNFLPSFVDKKMYGLFIS